jgi:hypothetical protein
MVAVGTVIAHRPPHRSRRALLTHRAPTSGRRRAEVGKADAASGAHPPFRSTQRSGSESGLRRLDGCSPWLRPFPPRPPPEVALLCSVASSVLWPHPTSHPRACSACGLWPSRADSNQGSGMDEISQVPYKGRLHVLGVSDCARLLSCKPIAQGGCCLLFSGTRSAPRNSTRFAAQYPARGLPCERFTSNLAVSRASLGAGAAG